MTVTKHENGIRCIGANLDNEFSSRAEQTTRRRGGLNEFSEFIKRGPQEKYLKYGLGENRKSILDSRLGSYT
jgi:hypothetical protein